VLAVARRRRRLGQVAQAVVGSRIDLGRRHLRCTSELNPSGSTFGREATLCLR
jgi:hypothetical protein